MERKTPAGLPLRGQAQPGHDPRALARARRWCATFLAVLEPLKAAGKYDGLLAQFPWGFRRTPREPRRTSRALRERCAGEPLFVEFRHASWIAPGARRLRCASTRLGYCAVDEPRLPGLLPPVTLRHRRRRLRALPRPQRGELVGDGRPPTAAGAPAGGRGSGDRYDYDYSRATSSRSGCGRSRELARAGAAHLPVLQQLPRRAGRAQREAHAGAAAAAGAAGVGASRAGRAAVPRRGRPPPRTRVAVSRRARRSLTGRST